MERRAGPEDGDKKLFGDICLEHDGGTPYLFKARVALEHAERADALRLAVGQRLGELIRAQVDVLFITAHLPEMALAELLQHVAQFGLEEHWNDDDKGAEHLADDPGEAAQFKDVRDRPDEADDKHTAQKLHRARADKQHKDPVYQKSDYQDIKKVLPTQVKKSQGPTPFRLSVYRL